MADDEIGIVFDDICFKSCEEVHFIWATKVLLAWWFTE
jgi:hypothetical protein